MNKLWIVTKNELIRYFISPLAYVYLIAFLLLNGSFAIYFGNFFDRGQASLLPMFSYQPWLYLLFEIVVMNIMYIYMHHEHENLCHKMVQRIVACSEAKATKENENKEESDENKESEDCTIQISRRTDDAD